MTKSKYALLIAVCLAVGISGCTIPTVQKYWSPIQGNKEGGIITLGYYHHGWAERPVASDHQALTAALQACRTLGYKSAAVFDFAQSQCQRYSYNNRGRSTCELVLVSRNYQCE